MQTLVFFAIFALLCLCGEVFRLIAHVPANTTYAVSDVTISLL